MTTELSHTGIKDNGQLTHASFKVYDYQNIGFRDASKVMGAVEAFRISLDRFYSRLMVKASKNQEVLRGQKHTAEARVSAIDKEISVKNDEITQIRKGRLAGIVEDIKAVKDEIRDIRQNPAKYADKTRDPFKYYLYMALMICLALFLIFFYSSVMYSAVFRSITSTKETIFNSVLYTHVFAEASQSLEMLMIVLLAPAIFIALGTILHHFFGKWGEPGIKNKLGVVLVFAGTFFFDSLLAFHIAKKLHDANAINSYDKIPEFTIPDALVDPNFWLVIFLGFVVYLILGTILFFFEKERNTKLALERIIRAKEENLRDLTAMENIIKEEIAALEKEITVLKLEAARLSSPEDKVFFSPHELVKIVTEYGLGWMQYLKNGKFKETELSVISDTLESFFRERNLKSYEQRTNNQ